MIDAEPQAFEGDVFDNLQEVDGILRQGMVLDSTVCMKRKAPEEQTPRGLWWSCRESNPSPTNPTSQASPCAAHISQHFRLVQAAGTPSNKSSA